MAKEIQTASLFGSATKAVYFESYIAFDDKYPFAVQILDENNKEVDMKVFETKDAALDFENTFNNRAYKYDN